MKKLTAIPFPRKHAISVIVSALVAGSNLWAETSATLPSGDVTLNVNQAPDGTYTISVSAYGIEFNAGAEKNPALMIDAAIKTFYPAYTSFEKDGNVLTLKSRFTATPSTTVFNITDHITANGDGEFSLDRNVSVAELGDNPYSDGFYSSFGLQFSNTDTLDEYDVFIPGVWYKANFEQAGNLPAHLPQATDTEFCYRDDRTPLPVVMMRDKASGVTLTLVHTNSRCETVLADSEGSVTDPGYQFGGTGVIKHPRTDAFSAVVTYPGSDLHAGGMGVRRHPVSVDFSAHSYSACFRINRTSGYAEAVDAAWNKAFSLYDPEIFEEDLKSAYRALLETCEKYYLAPNRPTPYNAYAPGFPWGVSLKDFSMNKNTYEIGFVGSQTVAGYAMFRAGIEEENQTWQRYGNAILNFWAQNSLSDLGLPKSRYAALNGTWDDWAYTAIRQACWGMQGLLNAWCFAERNGISRPAWLDAAVKFGDWMVENQNPDGSYYKEYHPFKIIGGKHPAGDLTKFTTTCALRFLVELYIATGNSSYYDCLMKAADYCYRHVHDGYHYIACVIDNPQTIDSESGQQAINGFLAMFDFTGDKKWLDAAEQAAIYTETWTHMMDVPVETDQTQETDWPRDRSIIGQHLIAIGHSACDLGFAWSSFALYRLYLLTGKEHYLQSARISAHNTKQSMNLGGKLYPGEAEGLQQEAFQIKTNPGNPRRMKSIMEALTWNFAAHLDPMIRFKDAFGTVDLEEVERMPKEQVLKMQERYAIYQSSDYGQKTGGVTAIKNTSTRNVWITGDTMFVSLPEPAGINSVKIYDMAGRCLCNRTLAPSGGISRISLATLPSGVMIVDIGNGDNIKLHYRKS